MLRRWILGAALAAGACNGGDVPETDDPSGVVTPPEPTAMGGDDGSTGESPTPGTGSSSEESGGETSGEPEPEETTTGEPSPDEPLLVSLILRQTVQSCGGCGIWFDPQGNAEDRPRLEVTWTAPGSAAVTQSWQYELGDGGDLLSTYVSPSPPAEAAERHHVLLIKQGPANVGLLAADLSAIPADATIDAARLHLHIHTDEGLAYGDHESVLEVWECSTPWDWNTATWDQPWPAPGGDFTRLVREIRAYDDLHALGFNKANPHAHFDFTPFLQLLQSERQ